MSPTKGNMREILNLLKKFSLTSIVGGKKYGGCAVIFLFPEEKLAFLVLTVLPSISNPKRPITKRVRFYN